MSRTPWNILVILALAAVVDLVPGGGTGASVVTQAVSLLFLGALGWFASIVYRQNRLSLLGLGERRRALLYGAIGVATLTLTATKRLTDTSGGSIAWIVLLGASLYAVVAVVISARRL